MADQEYDIVMEELDEATCWRLLARAGFGRIGFADGDEVLILPVNSGVVGERVVFRTADETLLGAVGDGTQVAFESDDTDRVAESGWSVLVRGHLWDVTDSPEAAEWHDLMVRPWAPGPRDRWMAIVPTVITGRAIRRHRILHGREHPPYMSPD